MLPLSNNLFPSRAVYAEQSGAGLQLAGSGLQIAGSGLQIAGSGLQIAGSGRAKGRPRKVVSPVKRLPVKTHQIENAAVPAARLRALMAKK